MKKKISQFLGVLLSSGAIIILCEVFTSTLDKPYSRIPETLQFTKDPLHSWNTVAYVNDSHRLFNIYRLQRHGNHLRLTDDVIAIPQSEMVVLNQHDFSIAVGGGIRMENCSEPGDLEKQLLFKDFLPAFCNTISNSNHYQYHVIFAYDYNDPCLYKDYNRKQVTSLFEKVVAKNCPDVEIDLELLQCTYSGKPAWAQNDAMMAAYWRNITYFYRLNDDTIMKDSDWARHFIGTLHNFNPPNLGVVGPYARQGNVGILTHDFTHRTHVDIHGVYYPRQLTDWYADGWITKSYRTVDRFKRLRKIKVQHTENGGRRYDVRKQSVKKVTLLNKHASLILSSFKPYFETPKISSSITDSDNNIVSYSFNHDNKDYCMGALRNLIITNRLLPHWKMRVYIGRKVPLKIIQLLKLYGATVVYVDDKEIAVPSDYWAYLVADDPNVTRFLVRNVTHRLSPRQTRLINDWQLSEHAYHAIRDRPWHADMALVPDLFGAVREHLHHKLNTSMFDIILGPTQEERIGDVKSLLNDVIWPVIKEDVLSHDSVAADKWTGSVGIKQEQYDVMRIGQPTSQHEEELQEI